MISLLFLWNTLVYAQGTKSITLKAGYNAVNIEKLTLVELVNAVGFNRLLSIQGAGQGTAYKKSYVDAGKAFLNSFNQAELGQAYWIQVTDEVTISYEKVSYGGIQKIALHAGWNFVAPFYSLTLDEIKGQVGAVNLEVIQGAGQGTAYKKSYVDAGKDFLNSFTAFEDSQGYWVKVTNESELTFEFELDTVAKDNAFNDINVTKVIGNRNYIMTFYTSSMPVDETSQNSIAVYGTINGENVVIEINDSYLTDARFQLKLFDTHGELLVMSEIVDFDADYIEFGDLTFTPHELATVAVGVDLNPISVTKVVNGKNYQVILYASTSVTETATNSIAVYGKLANESGEQVLLEANGNYPSGTKFQVKVFDADDVFIGMSDIFDYEGSAIDFGLIAFGESLPMSDAEAVALAKVALSLGNTSNITSNLSLPTTGLHNTTITYSSSNLSVLSNSGVVDRAEFGNGDTTVVLTATITKNEVSDTKRFTVIVKEEELNLPGV
ncbi:MAG: hypothetical protein K0U38_08505 [Epsilonproteobacteria bacterium]|nr:hypothetical protein [Campylobacterota bacterium]